MEQTTNLGKLLAQKLGRPVDNVAEDEAMDTLFDVEVAPTSQEEINRLASAIDIRVSNPTTGAPYNSLSAEQMKNQYSYPDTQQIIQDYRQMYSKAIDLLTNTDAPLDYRAIVIALAKADPKMFVELATKRTKPQWMNEYLSYLENGKAIEAIRLLRDKGREENNGQVLGLKDAKEITDWIRAKKGYSSYFTVGDIVLDPHWLRIANLIIQ